MTHSWRAARGRHAPGRRCGCRCSASVSCAPPPASSPLAATPGASSESISRRAGMSKATFYGRFANKEECMLALFDIGRGAGCRGAMAEAARNAPVGDAHERVRQPGPGPSWGRWPSVAIWCCLCRLLGSVAYCCAQRPGRPGRRTRSCASPTGALRAASAIALWTALRPCRTAPACTPPVGEVLVENVAWTSRPGG